MLFIFLISGSMIGMNGLLALIGGFAIKITVSFLYFIEDTLFSTLSNNQIRNDIHFLMIPFPLKTYFCEIWD